MLSRKRMCLSRRSSRFTADSGTKILVAVFLLTLVLFTNPIKTRCEEHRTLVVATIPPLASIAKEVVGERARVVYLVPTTSDPHQYSLRPGDAQLLERADLIICVGKEPFLGELPEDVRDKMIGWEDWLSAGVYVVNDNPHYLWLYPPNAIKVAEVIRNRISGLDPSGSIYYERNFNRFKERVQELISWIHAYVRSAGVEGKSVLLAGSHFVPLMRIMGLRVVEVLIRGEGKIPGPGDVVEFEKRGRQGKASAVIVLATQTEGDEGRLGRTVARDLGIPVIYVYGTMFSGNDTYCEFIKYTVTTVASGISSGGKGNGEGVPIECIAAVMILSLISLLELIILWRSGS